MSLFDILINGQPAPNSGDSLADKLFSMPMPGDAPAPPTVAAPILPAATPSPAVQPAPDAWKPVHRNLLGRIADAMLIGHGQKPIYEERMRERDLQSAMQGFDPANPIPTIKRIAQIPGMADDAYKMYQQYETDQERDEARKTRAALQKDLIWQRLGALGSVANEKNYPAVRDAMQRYVKMWGENPDDYPIPENFDADALNVLTQGAIKPTDQARIEQGDRRIDQGDRRLDQGDTKIEDQRSYRERRLGQIDTHEANVGGRFATKEAAIQYRHDHPVARPKSVAPAGKVVKTPNGMMELSPSGMTGRIGDQIWQNQGNGQWKRVK